MKTRSITIVAIATVLAAIAAPAIAANTVTQVLTAGTRTASVADLSLGSAAYSHSAQTNTGSMTLTADDSSATGLGWNVTIQTSAFVYSGANSAGATNIPASDFSLTSAAAPTATAGQAVDAVFGPKVPVVSPVGTLDSARKAVQATALYGKGTYTQALGVSLVIPAQSVAGTYTGTLTTTISAGL